MKPAYQQKAQEKAVSAPCHKLARKAVNIPVIAHRPTVFVLAEVGPQRVDVAVGACRPLRAAEQVRPAAVAQVFIGYPATFRAQWTPTCTSDVTLLLASAGLDCNQVFSKTHFSGVTRNHSVRLLLLSIAQPLLKSSVDYLAVERAAMQTEGAADLSKCSGQVSLNQDGVLARWLASSEKRCPHAPCKHKHEIYINICRCATPFKLLRASQCIHNIAYCSHVSKR